MKSLIKLFNDWEIQLLVLLSFTLQLFLFFAGSLRRHWTNMFLRFSIWMAYLGADMVAVFALGYLSRHVGSTTAGRDTLGRAEPLAFFWAPFLLVHLGGQDTITAFSMEDNNLWLRHSLNMVVQVVLTTYILWMSIGRHNMQLLISGIFIFAAGVIKYGERIWSLKYGSMESLESSTGNQYMQQLALSVDVDAGYPITVCTGLRWMPRVHQVFTSRSSVIHIDQSRLGHDELFKLVGFELGMLHNDLYTKAVVLRTRTGIILRCISQITVIVAFVTFLVSGNKHSYHRADIAVTYSLFIGGFFLDFCAIFISLRSPWTWLWLKARRCNMLARFPWFLFSNDAIGWSEKSTLRSIVAGQYNLSGWLVHTEQPRSFFSPLMMTVRKSLTLCGAQEDKIFWLSKILGWKYAKGDKIMECLRYACSLWNDYGEIMECIQGLLGPLIFFDPNDFGNMLVYMHIQTEAHLRQSHLSDVESTVCRQLSRYMMYLLVTHPSLLPLDTSAVATLDLWRAAAASEGGMLMSEMDSWSSSTEALKALDHLWVWAIMYAAAKSRSEMHAALLARGSGELLTFVWLMMAHLKKGDLSALTWFRKVDHREVLVRGVFGQRFNL